MSEDDAWVSQNGHEEVGAPADAFAPENIGGISMIIQMRTYDVLMAILTKLDENSARDLLELHQQGILLSTAPWMNGVFVTDTLNSQVDETNTANSERNATINKDSNE